MAEDVLMKKCLSASRRREQPRMSVEQIKHEIRVDLRRFAATLTLELLAITHRNRMALPICYWLRIGQA